MCAAKAYLDVLMRLRRYFNGFGFTELRTDCLCFKQHARLFKALSLAPLYTAGGELFVRCSAVPSLALYYLKHNGGASGVYETGKLALSRLNFFCAVGDSRVFLHLFRSVYSAFF